MPDLGEQALSKLAEVGLASQLDAVESLDINIQTDPGKFISGAVDAVSVEGKGMVMQKDLRVESIQLETNRIAINPLSAAFGKIELTQSTDAETQITLTEEDIQRALNSDFVRQKLQNLQVRVADEVVTVDTQQMTFGLPGDRKVLLSTNVSFGQAGESKQVSFTAVPHVSQEGQAIALSNVEYAEGQNLSPEITDAMLEQANALLALRSFEFDKMSFRLKSLDIQQGKLMLQAIARIEQFPGA